MKIKEYQIHLFISLIVCITIVIILPKDSLFGSYTDWMSQHITIPNYLRNLFYETGNMFPDFAPNLGAGQNIYSFSYYGLFSPMLFLSYAFPMISMTDFIVGYMIVSAIASSNLCFYWLRANKICKSISFVTTLIFLFSSPYLFHSHRQLMFVNYMPWLFMALIGVDLILNKNKANIFIFSIVMIILNSYFFSVTALFISFVYFLYKLYLKNEIFFCKKNIMLSLKFLFYILIGICITGIMLIPTAKLLLDQSRGGETISKAQLLRPDIGMNMFFYDVYGAGLSVIAWFGIFLQYTQKKKRKLAFFLSILFVVPIFSFVLNGMLYVRGKVFIAFIPIIVLLIADSLQLIQERKIKWNWWYLICLFAPCFYNKVPLWYLVDAIITVILVYMFIKYPKQKFLFSFIVVPLAICLVSNQTEEYVKLNEYSKITNKKTSRIISQHLNKEKYTRFSDMTYPLSTSNISTNSKMYKSTYYTSVYNKEYNEFYYSIMHNPIRIRNRVAALSGPNVFFQILMGERYLLTNKRLPFSYEAIAKTPRGTLAKSNLVMPIAYTTSNIYSEKEFDQLKYPHTLDTIYNNAIVSNTKQKSYQSKMQQVKIDYDVIKKSDKVKATHINDAIELIVSKESNIVLKPNIDLKNKIVLLSFELKNVKYANKRDTTIKINGITNKLSSREAAYPNENNPFYYTFSQNDDITEFKVTLSKGEYCISKVKFFIIDKDDLKQHRQEVDEMHIDKKIETNVLSGHISNSQDGYLITSIPYQKGIEVMVNGKKITYERVNKAFVGFKLDKGEYEIKISFKAPGKQVGMYVSVAGICLWLICIVVEKKRSFK